MKGLATCPCPCRHTFIAEMHRHERGSAVALLWTKIPNERRILLERWLSSEYRGIESTDSELHRKLMSTTPDRVFSAMLTEYKALDVVIPKEIGKIPSYREYCDGDKGKPPNVLFLLNIEQAETVLFYAGGMDATCDSCNNFKAMTISSLLAGKRVCKKCRESALIMENQVDAYEITENGSGLDN